jgi:alkanesulfonate monooxygenase SsuD/methylene tetrahydromethanopterin reductase-like flavin-dependent oxidoreductase (luciferase family)
MGITLLPLHDPVQIAEELAVLDQLSGGRLDVGIGRASTPLEYAGFEVPFEQGRARVDEGLAILRGVWTDDSFSYRGDFRQVAEVRLVPKPLQQPHPPLYLACNSAETVPIAARHGLPMMSSWLVLDQALVERREVYRQVSAQHGHPPAEVEARLAQTWSIRFVYVAEDERAAREEPRQYLLDFQDAATERRRAVDRSAASTGLDYEAFLASGAAFFGTPDQVVEQISRCRERTGLQNLLCHMSFRAMDPVKAQRSMALFAAKVMPRLQA